MVSTKHCCWGECKTDSRYREKWPKSLKEVEESGRKVFILFPKPSQDIEKCRRWIVACSRQFFTENNITRNTYICALHWPGEKGPTEEFPDPLRANFSPAQASRALVKRKAASRAKPVTPIKRAKIVDGQDSGEEMSDFNPVNDIHLLCRYIHLLCNYTNSLKLQLMCQFIRARLQGEWSWMGERKPCSRSIYCQRK